MGFEVEIVAGSYEQISFGYRVCRNGEDWTATADFTHHAHTACLSAVASTNRYIATGSKDETIQLYDMKKKIDQGALLHHDGTISCLEFYGTSHLLSGGEDGLMCVWRTKKWECLKTIRAHKGQLSSLSVHPSGKLALSVGTDRTLRTWNLTDGRSAFIKTLKQSADLVKWSLEGDTYVVVTNNIIDVYNLETATVTATITNPKRISSVKFLQNTCLAVAGDDESVRLYDLTTERCMCEFKAHENRIKAVDSFMVDDFCVVVTASNDGLIKLWKLHLDEDPKPPALLLEVNTTARLTCLTVFKPTAEDKPTEEQPTSSTATEDLPLPSKNKRVRIATEEVILEGDCKPKKTKRGGKKRKSQ
ncbi:p21-activated protein kinase-interacting protein 1-like [Clupea harengus]|uniref:P21-activated protein kinase-interacting protein 1-like n=1 Tax=Clupea harengus TaxID=7950 RepID=A0A6P3VIE7_CLUHA|nr:p21-activated protein kinase-interacting protein 1-like [Clupea harengus]